ncbi:hypothetical protein F5X71_35480 [Nocardia brasiliensis]|uniref:Uncharacterized protein n=1 Tax=Nocardia brasiliensis TaxID=37326 RepID=A0A6G9Y129_NOCBR|nr:hypothetical protein [Nocardia brasiliensis]QIS06915.1 hypothetical protein F5X71_35480 [Nocardia brasiliensis]
MTYYPAAQQTARPPQRTWDVILTIVLYCAAVVAGLIAAYLTVFFAFAADACGSGRTCHDEYLNAAFAVSWGGTAAALVVSLVMIIVAAVKRWLMFYWPILAMAVIVGSFVCGASLASQV